MVDEPQFVATIPAVGRAMAILESLVAQRDGLSVKELSAQLGLTPGMVSRILSTLQQNGYVYQHPLSDRFHLTLKLLRMGYTHAGSMDLDEICLPVMRQLADETGELVQLAAVDGLRMTFVLKVEGTNPLSVRSMLGQQVPLHASACGKCWLASLPEDLALERLANQPLTQFTPSTLIQLGALAEELERIRRDGYAVEREEWTPGVVAVAAPVRVPHRIHESTVGALVIAFPAAQFEDVRLNRYITEAQASADRIGQRWPPHLENHLYRKTPPLT